MDSPLHLHFVVIKGVHIMRIRACTSAALAVLAVAFMPATALAQEQEEQGTQATAVGVTVTVKADAWSGQPAELTQVIPLLVTIENNSQVPIRLRYSEFRLAGDGERASVLPPFEITGTERRCLRSTESGATPIPLEID